MISSSKATLPSTNISMIDLAMLNDDLKNNTFALKLREEFEGHIERIFDCSYEEFLEFYPDGKEEFYKNCNDIFVEKGMPGLRWWIRSEIAMLDFILFMRSEPKEWLFEDFVNRALSLNLGLKSEDLVPWEWHSIHPEKGIVRNKD